MSVLQEKRKNALETVVGAHLVENGATAMTMGVGRNAGILHRCPSLCYSCYWRCDCDCDWNSSVGGP